jgi:hypothetical protein
LILERISKSKLLVAMSSDEMKRFNLTFMHNSTINNNAHINNILKNLLVIARAETGFNADNHNLMVEALPQNEGCVMVITLMPLKKHKRRRLYKIKDRTEPLIFSFEEMEDIICMSQRIYRLDLVIDHSQIVKDEKKYYLIVYAKRSVNSKIMPLISEYGQLVGKGFIESARQNERGQVVIVDDAINLIGAAFN